MPPWVTGVMVGAQNIFSPGPVLAVGGPDADWFRVFVEKKVQVQISGLLNGLVLSSLHTFFKRKGFS